MSKQSLKKRLYVTNLKLNKAIKDNKSSFAEKLISVVLMIGLTIFGPDFKVKGTKQSIQETFNLNYYEAMALCAIIVFIFFLFTSAALRYQHHNKMKRLQKEKDRIKDLIDRYYTN